MDVDIDVKFFYIHTYMHTYIHAHMHILIRIHFYGLGRPRLRHHETVDVISCIHKCIIVHTCTQYT